MRLLQKAVLRFSEIIFGAELKLSLGEHGGGNDSGCTRAIVNIVVRQGEGGVVEGVKGFCANLQVSALAEIEDLAKRQIGGHFSRPNQAIFLRIAEGVRLGQRETVDIEPIVDVPLSGREVAIADLIGAKCSGRARIRRIVANPGRHVESGVHRKDSTKMPATEYQIFRPASA